MSFSSGVLDTIIKKQGSIVWTGKKGNDWEADVLFVDFDGKKKKRTVMTYKNEGIKMLRLI